MFRYVKTRVSKKADDEDAQIEWRMLDQAGQVAWSIFQRIRGQITVLNPMCDDPKKVRTKLDTVAITSAMDWAEVPLGLRGLVWDRVLMAHDVEQNGGRSYTTLCWHGPGGGFDERCAAQLKRGCAALMGAN